MYITKGFKRQRVNG